MGSLPTKKNRAGLEFQIIDVLAEVMDLKDFEVLRTHNSTDIPGWDSINHVRLIYEVEERFAIRLSVKEIEALRTVGDLIDTVSLKINKPKK